LSTRSRGKPSRVPAPQAYKDECIEYEEFEKKVAATAVLYRKGLYTSEVFFYVKTVAIPITLFVLAW